MKNDKTHIKPAEKIGSLPIVIVYYCMSIMLSVYCRGTALAADTETTDWQGFTAGEIVTPSGTGRLEPIDPANNKWIIHLEGSAYDMGFQHGYLLNDAVIKFAYGYPIGAMNYLLDLQVPEDAFAGIDLIDILTWPFLEPKLKAVPEEFIEELQGIIDGVAAAGYLEKDSAEAAALFRALVRLNMGFDCLGALIYPILTPLNTLANISEELSNNLHACNGFIAKGSATETGGVIMGRDYMNSGKPGAEMMLIMTYQPSAAGANTFVSVSTPAMVGVQTAMNNHGLAIGIDIVYAMDTSYIKLGMGAAFAARHIIQYQNELSQAKNFLKDTSLGCPTMFIVGDGRGTEQGGFAFEKSAHHYFVRNTDYHYPRIFKTLKIWPDQLETNDDILLLTNSYVTPWMGLKAMGSIIGEDRYIALFQKMNAVLENENINIDNGMNLINFLKESRGYGDDDIIEMSRTVFDLERLELRTLYGHYNEPWVSYTFDKGCKILPQ